MTIRVAINGFGRIGRMILRRLIEMPQPEIEVVALNDPTDLSTLAHLLAYDSIAGHCTHPIKISDDHIIIGAYKIAVSHATQPQDCPWRQHQVDLVLECSGRFCQGPLAKSHLQAGAKKVLISAPASDVDATVVYGVNDHILTGKETIVSNASCTTNCLAPVAYALHQALGIESGLITTIHAFTNDQNIQDAPHKDLYRARAGTLSMIPTQTGAARAIGLVIPELNGKLDGLAIRVPTPNVSLVDAQFICQETTTVKAVNAIMKAASQSIRGGILAYNDKPLVSIDFNRHPASSIFDANQTKVMGRQIKVFAWYDNEWGFANRMIDTAHALFAMQPVDANESALPC